MREGLCIRFSVGNATIADIHLSVSSLVNSLDVTSLGLSIFFDGETDFSIDSEKKRLASAKIKVLDELTEAKYVMNMTAGETVSRSFLYKSLYALSANNCSAVCPEYTILKIGFGDLRVKNNNGRIAANIPNMIIDSERIKGGATSIVAFAVRDTCSATRRLSSRKKSKKKIKALPILEVGFSVSGLRSSELSLSSRSGRKEKIYRFLKVASKRFCGRSKVMLEIRRFIGRLFRILSSRKIGGQAAPVSLLMADEINSLAEIDYSVRGCLSYLPYEKDGDAKSILSTAATCKGVLAGTSSDKYDYVIVLPWLIAGGVDLFAINYLNTISRLHPEMKILALTTNNMIHKNLTKAELGLDERVDLVSLSDCCDDDEMSELNISALYSLILMFNPSYLHIMQSKTGYEVLAQYGEKLRKAGLNVIFSSYNYLSDAEGHCFGYTVQELPSVYRPGDVVTTDNIKSKKLWVEKFGFKADDVLVHNQLFSVSDVVLQERNVHDGIKILWAAHVRPEKNPEVVSEIARALATDNIEIDSYGLFLPINWPTGENPLVTSDKNLHYKGEYGDFFKDIDLKNYDIFLYTSKTDGTPNVILEAAIAGIPIVSSKIGGIPDAAGDNAYLVENPQNAEEFATGIREVLSHYDEYLEKAKRLQKTTISKHNKNSFDVQVEQMLKKGVENA